MILPIVVGIWLAMLLWPIHERLRRLLPDWLAAGLAISSLFIGLSALGAFAWYAAESAAAHVQRNQPRYAAKYESTRDRLVDAGVPPPWLPRWTSEDDEQPDHRDHHSNPNGPQPPRNGAAPPHPDAPTLQDGESSASTNAASDTNGGNNNTDATNTNDTNNNPTTNNNGPPTILGQTRSEFLEWVSGGLRSGFSVFAALALTVIFLFLTLIEFPTWRRWASSTFGPQRAERFGVITRGCSSIVRRYFVAKLITGLVSGGATALFLWAMGVPMPLVWGLLTLIMNFIPNIGAVISGVPPTLLAILELGIAEALVVAAGLLAIEMLVGNLLDPLIQGDALDLSPFVVLASLLFWGWLWGIVGAVMAPTLSAAIVEAWQHTNRQHQRNHAHNNRNTDTPNDHNHDEHTHA